MPGEYGGEYGPGLGTGIANPPRFSGEPLADMTRAKLMQLLLKAGDGVESGDPAQSGLERLRDLGPIAHQLASGHSGQTPSRSLRGGESMTWNDKDIIQMMMALMKTDPMALPGVDEQRQVELGPPETVESARQDATAQSQVGELFR